MLRISFLILCLFNAYANCADKNVLICGLIKNNASQLRKSLPMIHKISTLFQDYRIIIIENNSTDGTKELLQEFKARENKLNLISNNYTQQELLSFSTSRTNGAHACRLEVISYLRNKLLSLIDQDQYKNFEYVIMIDLDLAINRNCIRALEDIFKKNCWDAVFANGIAYPSKVFVDRFAFRSKELPLGPELDPQWWEKPFALYYCDSKEWIPVYSSFGGMGVYRKEAIKNCHYSALPNQSLEDFTQKLLKDEYIKSRPSSLRYFDLKQGLLANKSLNSFQLLKKIKETCLFSNKKTKKIGYSLSTDPNALFYLNSDTENLPTLCEHVPLHYQMILNGYDRLFIHPQLILVYP